MGSAHHLRFKQSLSHEHFDLNINILELHEKYMTSSISILLVDKSRANRVAGGYRRKNKFTISFFLSNEQATNI